MRKTLEIILISIIFLLILIFVWTQNWMNNNEEDVSDKIIINRSHTDTGCEDLPPKPIIVGNYTCEQNVALLMNLRDFRIDGKHVCPLFCEKINWTFEKPEGYDCVCAIKVRNYYFASFYYTNHTKALKCYDDFILILKRKYIIIKENVTLKENAHSWCGNSFVDSRNSLFKAQNRYIYVELLRLNYNRASILVVIGDEDIWQIINAK